MRLEGVEKGGQLGAKGGGDRQSAALGIGRGICMVCVWSCMLVDGVLYGVCMVF